MAAWLDRFQQLRHCLFLWFYPCRDLYRPATQEALWGFVVGAMQYEPYVQQSVAFKQLRRKNFCELWDANRFLSDTVPLCKYCCLLCCRL